MEEVPRYERMLYAFLWCSIPMFYLPYNKVLINVITMLLFLRDYIDDKIHFFNENSFSRLRLFSK